MKKCLALVLVLLLCLSLCGCGVVSERRLVGTWTGDGFDLAGMELEAESAEQLIFRQDGTVELVLPNGKSWICTYGVVDETLTLQTVEGDLSVGLVYELKGDTLTLNPKSKNPGVFVREEG